MTGQEARYNEREAVEPQPNGDLRVTDVLGRTARLHWSRFHGLIIAMDAPAVYLGQPETLAWIAEAAGYRKHPGPEITDAFRAYVDHLGVDANEEHDGDEWWSGYRQAQRDNILRATAALRAPIGEGGAGRVTRV